MGHKSITAKIKDFQYNIGIAFISVDKLFTITAIQFNLAK